MKTTRWRPAALMGLAGGALYALTLLAPQPRELPASASAERRDAEIRREWLNATGQLPSVQEWPLLRRQKEDEAVLLAEALHRDYHRTDPLVRRRLQRDLAFLGIDPALCNCDAVEEAIALGLHEYDLVARRRLIHRLQEELSVAALREPAAEVAITAAYTQWLGQRPDRQRYSFRQQLAESSANGAPFLIAGNEFHGLTAEQVASRFGAEFLNALRGADPGRWLADVPSGYGRHRLQLIERNEAPPPAREQLATRLAADIDEARARTAVREALAALRPRYGLLP